VAKFGIFYEHQLPSRTDDSEYQLMQNFTTIELADKLGSSTWEVEHHFLEEYSHSMRLRSAASQRTKNIRLSRHRAVAAAVQPSGASRNASPRSTSCRTVAPTSALVSRLPKRESAAS
jgi:hypothetical protein